MNRFFFVCLFCFAVFCFFLSLVLSSFPYFLALLYKTQSVSRPRVWTWRDWLFWTGWCERPSLDQTGHPSLDIGGSVLDWFDDCMCPLSLHTKPVKQANQYVQIVVSTCLVLSCPVSSSVRVRRPGNVPVKVFRNLNDIRLNPAWQLRTPSFWASPLKINAKKNIGGNW